ncbi:autotransporter assembly complex family protein [Marinobacter nanhaiticus D15-8W]|uniref:autotransporter assembly complex protein TamA n=1 Tax=Marinobacter nanhaiticus TaxID=1305740 RepID=UPI0002CCA9D5|nr:autotransporter assembly complex family protein [Marinobacter nanhaiticus]BES71997.1 autotransporter assembly complex family protein [Marinobacter nanhaiticus D15-8W]
MTIRTTRLLALFGALILVLCPVCAAYAAGQVVVRVQGDYPALQENATNFVGTVEDRSTASLRRYASHAEDQVREALRALGYYSPSIRWRIEEDEAPTLVLEVEPGEPVKIAEREVRVEGPASDDPEFSLGNLSSIAPGQIVNHGAYSAVRSRIQNRARTLGYFQGEFVEHALRVDPDAKTAEVRLVYRSGPRYAFGEVTFESDGTFEEQLLEGFVEILPGEPYSADKVAELDRNLSNSGYFSSVIIDAPPDQAQDLRVPVKVRLRTRDPRSVAAGVGFSTDVGPRFRGSWTEHWINAMGHSWGAETELSQPRQNLTAYYELPLDPPMTDAIRFTTGYQREDIEDIESERLTFGQQWRHQMDNEWLRVLGIRWEGERYTIGDEENNSQLLLPSIGFSKLVADSPLDPSRGYRLQMDVTGAHRSLLSDADIAHVLGVARGLITVGDGHRFLGRLQVGAVATNDFDDVPPSLRFFAGGDQSVRGYGYETLAPEDEDGNTVGGQYMLVGSVEYQYPLTNTWRLAAFYDRGNAINDLNDPLATGVGMGIRWVSPVGPLRLDIAKGLDEELGGGWRIHFSMGPEL